MARSRRHGEDQSASKTAEALVPVGLALKSSSRARADALISASQSDVRAELQAANRQASLLVAAAIAQATDSAKREAARQLAIARRTAREIVLLARRQAYEALRAAAVQALLERADSREGRVLARRWEGLVLERIGEGAIVHEPKGSDHVRGVLTMAESGRRRAWLDATSLVDAALATMPAEIEQLWK